MAPIRSVLLVDDDPTQLELLRDYFATSGVEQVMCAGDIKTAGRTLKEADGEPDLIVLDLHMPDGDGIEFIQQLHERRASSRLVVVSGACPSLLKAATSLSKAHGLSMVGAFRKPLRVEDIDFIAGGRGEPAAMPAA